MYASDLAYKNSMLSPHHQPRSKCRFIQCFTNTECIIIEESPVQHDLQLPGPEAGAPLRPVRHHPELPPRPGLGDLVGVLHQCQPDMSDQHSAETLSQLASPRVNGEVVAGHRLCKVEVPGWSKVPPPLHNETAIGVCQEPVPGVDVRSVPDMSRDITISSK